MDRRHPCWLPWPANTDALGRKILQFAPRPAALGGNRDPLMVADVAEEPLDEAIDALGRSLWLMSPKPVLQDPQVRPRSADRKGRRG